MNPSQMQIHDNAEETNAWREEVNTCFKLQGGPRRERE
jgi:hypothetical protein